MAKAYLILVFLFWLGGSEGAVRDGSFCLLPLLLFFAPPHILWGTILLISEAWLCTGKPQAGFPNVGITVMCYHEKQANPLTKLHLSGMAR